MPPEHCVAARGQSRWDRRTACWAVFPSMASPAAVMVVSSHSLLASVPGGMKLSNTLPLGVEMPFQDRQMIILQAPCNNNFIHPGPSLRVPIQARRNDLSSSPDATQATKVSEQEVENAPAGEKGLDSRSPGSRSRT